MTAPVVVGVTNVDVWLVCLLLIGVLAERSLIAALSL